MRTEGKSWNEAENECVKSGAHLASIHSDEEMVFIGKLHAPNEVYSTWLGGYRDGKSFNWTDGTSMNYENWNSGEPNNSGGKENCIEWYSIPAESKHNKWNDIPCDVQNRVGGYLCKRDK